MKLKEFLFSFVALFILSIVACERIQQTYSFDQWIEDGHISISAMNGDNPTKTAIQSDGSILWNPYDSINVFYGNFNLGKFTGLNSTQVKSTVFRSSDTFVFGTIEGATPYPFIGVYPFSPQNSVDDGSLTLSVPSTQKAVSGSFAPGSFPSIAHSDNLQMAFYNVCGGLRFKVLNNGIRSVSFRGNNGEILAGSVKASFDESGIPQIEGYKDSVTKVSLECQEGFVPGEWYYISLLPASLNKGFTIEMSNGLKTVEYVSDKNTTVKRSVFGTLTDIDDGLDLNLDWKDCDFFHKSLLFAIPNCSFSSFYLSTEEYLIKDLRKQTEGHMEFIQMFVNGPARSSNYLDFLSKITLTSIPFELTDFREKKESGTTPYSTYLSTENLYGTVSGIAINSRYNGDELKIETSLYFKKADNYKIAVALVQDMSTYPVYTYSGRQTTNMDGDGLLRQYLTDIFGEDLTVVSDNSVLYRSYKTTVSDPSIKENLRVLVYILRPYGDRDVVSNGDFGSYYVDNSLSALAGVDVQLPMVKQINSGIEDINYGGTITF